MMAVKETVLGMKSKGREVSNNEKCRNNNDNDLLLASVRDEFIQVKYYFYYYF